MYKCMNVFELLYITTLNGQTIERILEYKYLGIWLDQKHSKQRQKTFKVPCANTKFGKVFTLHTYGHFNYI